MARSSAKKAAAVAKLPPKQREAGGQGHRDGEPRREKPAAPKPRKTVSIDPRDCAIAALESRTHARAQGRTARGPSPPRMRELNDAVAWRWRPRSPDEQQKLIASSCRSSIAKLEGESRAHHDVDRNEVPERSATSSSAK
jgi:hypothetical protein